MSIMYNPPFPRISKERRDGFAREAVYAEFRARDARALDYDGFSDREPNADIPLAKDFVAWLERLGVEATK